MKLKQIIKETLLSAVWLCLFIFSDNIKSDSMKIIQNPGRNSKIFTVVKIKAEKTKAVRPIEASTYFVSEIYKK